MSFLGCLAVPPGPGLYRSVTRSFAAFYHHQRKVMIHRQRHFLCQIPAPKALLSNSSLLSGPASVNPSFFSRGWKDFTSTGDFAAKVQGLESFHMRSSEQILPSRTLTALSGCEKLFSSSKARSKTPGTKYGTHHVLFSGENLCSTSSVQGYLPLLLLDARLYSTKVSRATFRPSKGRRSSTSSKHEGGKEPTDKDKSSESNSPGGEEEEKDASQLTLYQRFKKTYKEHGKVLVAVHLVTSTVWFGSFYTAARLGVDIVPYLESWNFSEKIISPFRSGGLGDIALAYLLYKLATPARYTVTIGGTNLVIKYLRKGGKMSPIAEEDTLRSMYKEGKADLKKRRDARMKRMKIGFQRSRISRLAKTRQQRLKGQHKR